VDDTADLYVALAKNASMTGQVMAVGKCFYFFFLGWASADPDVDSGFTLR
jgi:hypothetical protein